MPAATATAASTRTPCGKLTLSPLSPPLAALAAHAAHAAAHAADTRTLAATYAATYVLPLHGMHAHQRYQLRPVRNGHGPGCVHVAACYCGLH